MNQVALQQKLTDVIDEYEFKKNNVDNAIKEFQQAGQKLKSSACVCGAFGNTTIDVGHVYDSTIKSSLLKSAWRHIYNRLNIETIASAKDKKHFEQLLENPPELTMENLRNVYGDYIIDPYGNILRGLAEVFCSLDPIYKSHERMKIGVEGLPKRVIVTNVGSYGSWGRDQLKNILNALASYQGKPLIEHNEFEAILKDGDFYKGNRKYQGYKNGKYEEEIAPNRGVWLKKFKNKNAHLFFDKHTLVDINKALSEYYGEVLPDCSEKEHEKKQSTAVSKDLQYYPTPIEVVNRVLSGIIIKKGEKVLEPSCGCGRFMDALRDKGANVFGIEYDANRANECREKGHNVLIANFLETVPTGDYDRVIMNPPFYGKHYAKHVNYALKFLKEGGVLTAILPASARYDHNLLSGKWEDLPVGSFRESGTNINTTILTIFK